MTWSPLACGIVSGKYDSGIPPYSRASLKVKERPAPGLGEGTGRGRAVLESRGLGAGGHGAGRGFPGPLSAGWFRAKPPAAPAGLSPWLEALPTHGTGPG